MSVSGSRTLVVASSGATPSGIPVASTASVNIAEYYSFNPYPKRVSGYSFVGFGGEYIVSINSGIAYISTVGGGDIVLAVPNTIFYIGGSPFYTASAWELLNFGEGPTSDVYSLNSSTDPTTIPTSGWSPATTITAA
jgi:hypothetical protein